MKTSRKAVITVLAALLLPAVLVSGCTPGVRVPDVVALARDAAQTAIVGAGLSVGAVTEAYSDTVPAGSIMFQVPAAGTAAPRGSVVALTVSDGPQFPLVPELRGMEKVPAYAAIVGAGLKVGAISGVHSIELAPGLVVSSVPEAGTRVDSGSAVALNVSNGPPPATVPNVLGLGQPDAEAVIAGAGLVMGVVTRAYNSTVAQGAVASQTPEPGTRVEYRFPVSLSISDGPGPVTVPNVAGLTRNAAESAIANAGLALGDVTEVYSPVVPPGYIVSQTPLAGIRVPGGSIVTVTVSKGPQYVMVPNLVGMTDTDASGAILEMGLAVGSAVEVYSETVESGRVISQEPPAGVSAVVGSAVIMTISLGRQPIGVPCVTGMSREQAESAITAAGLAVGDVGEEQSDTVALGSVVSQSPECGGTVLPGSAVDLVISRGPMLTVAVPDVVGMTQSAASLAIIAAGLSVGTSTGAYSADVPVGKVMSQDPAAGNTVPIGSVVSLVVSEGPAPVPVPNVLGMIPADAAAALANAGLNLGVTREEFNDVYAAGRVAGQYPQAGKLVELGTPVDLVASRGPQEDSDPEMVTVPGGTFMMGNSGAGDDLLYGLPTEHPAHEVTLDTYEMGRFEATNRQYCNMLNWAFVKGWLKSADGRPWAGAGDLYAGDPPRLILRLDSSFCSIQCVGGIFISKTRLGLPGVTQYRVGRHPVVQVTWHGAVAFCNWLSLFLGLEPCYDMTGADWTLLLPPPAPGGFRLPTEAEWERAAAWDGARHWVYGFTADSVNMATLASQCNYLLVNEFYDIYLSNPLGLTSYPNSSPGGWFNGANINPNGGMKTVNSMSPVGCYDMSGNVWEWCQDWYKVDYYSEGAKTNPTGPASQPAAGATRVLRGGTLISNGTANPDFPKLSYLRTAARDNYYDSIYAGMAEDYIGFGFRLARTPESAD